MWERLLKGWVIVVSGGAIAGLCISGFEVYETSVARERLECAATADGQSAVGRNLRWPATGVSGEGEQECSADVRPALGLPLGQIDAPPDPHFGDRQKALLGSGFVGRGGWSLFPTDKSQRSTPGAPS